MKKRHFIILKNETYNDHLKWVKSCEKYSEDCSFDIIDINRSDWLEQIEANPSKIILAKPSGVTTLFREAFYERLSVLVNQLGYFSFPSLEAISIYENKKYFFYWLKANKLPHPNTHVFLTKEDCNSFISNIKLPIVGKINIGASGNGVTIIKTRDQLKRYVGKAFSVGISSDVGPKLNKGNILLRIVKKISNPSSLSRRLKTYKDISSDKQRYVIFQEFIDHSFEWRAVRIGDSYFAHKKIVVNDKASGLLQKGYENPPIKLLNFVKEVTDRFDFKSMAVDIFEHNGKYLINEMQCIFGQSDDFQMKVDGKIGRYIFSNDEWFFEEGDFNGNQCYDHRVEYLLKESIYG